MARTSEGYGVYRGGKGKLKLAHRVAWERAYGPIPPGQWVLHHCDNRGCIRPDHLFLGTNSDNLKDSWAKRRVK